MFAEVWYTSFPLMKCLSVSDNEGIAGPIKMFYAVNRIVSFLSEKNIRNELTFKYIY